MTNTQLLDKQQVLELVKVTDMPASVRSALIKKLVMMQAPTPFDVFRDIQRSFLIEDIICLITERFAEELNADTETICNEIDLDLIADRIEKHQECDWDNMQYYVEDYLAENKGKFSFNKKDV